MLFVLSVVLGKLIGRGEFGLTIPHDYLRHLLDLKKPHERHSLVSDVADALADLRTTPTEPLT